MLEVTNIKKVILTIWYRLKKDGIVKDEDFKIWIIGFNAGLGALAGYNDEMFELIDTAVKELEDEN